MELTEFLNELADSNISLNYTKNGVNIKLHNKHFEELSVDGSMNLDGDVTHKDVINTIERMLGVFLERAATMYSEMPKTKREPLTKAQKRFYNKLAKVIKEEGYHPSFSEMCAIAGYSSKNSAYRMVEKLVKKGWLSREGDDKVVVLTD